MNARPEDVFFQASGGHLENLDAAIAALDADASTRAWATAVRAARRLVDPQDASSAETTRSELESFVEASVPERRAACLGLVQLERAAFIAWDPDALRELIALRERLDGPPRWLDRARAWERLLGGDVDGLDAVGKALHAAGAAAKDASLVIDAALLRAMACLTQHDLEEATALSRRASRMARTEGLRAERYHASLVLARVRRRAGRPHLATRILSAIAAIAPDPWIGWLRWERLLSGGRPTARTGLPDAPAMRAAVALEQWLSAAVAGDRDAFEHARDAALEATAGFAEIADEARALADALDPALPVDSLSARVAPWASGVVDETPAGLHGIVGPPDGPADSTIASVVARQGAPPRRVLRVATALLDAEGDVVRLARTRLRRGRVDTAVAALALGGDAGLADAELFAKAYGFDFSASVHAGVLDVLVHRMRARVEGAARIDRDHGRMRLTALGVLLLPDPRCVEHVEERLLRVIARHGGVTTRQAADELDVSVRTAQLALRRLLESGDCVLNRDGRRIEYLVEDTTFTAPTIY